MLAAIGFRCGEPAPAAVDELRVGFLETLRRRDGAVSRALAAFTVADLIERCEHFLAELSAFA